MNPVRTAAHVSSTQSPRKVIFKGVVGARPARHALRASRIPEKDILEAIANNDEKSAIPENSSSLMMKTLRLVPSPTCKQRPQDPQVP